jgi:hypothetical protein
LGEFGEILDIQRRTKEKGLFKDKTTNQESQFAMVDVGSHLEERRIESARMAIEK